MKPLLDVVRRVFIFHIVLVMGLVPAAAALAVPVLNLAIAPNTGPVAPGQNVTFVITVSNTGDTTTNTFNLNATVPNNTMVPADQDEGAGCGSAGATNTDCLAGQTLVWQINLLPGESLSRTFTAVVDSTSPPLDGSALTSTASTSLGLSVNGTVMVRSAPGLNITLDATPGSVSPDSEYRYTLSYSNAGSSTANTDLSFSLPAGASIVSASDGGVIGAGQVTWDTGDLPAGASGTRAVVAQVSVSADIGALILAGAQLTDSSGTEPEASANAVTTVGTPLEISVSTLPDPVQPGQNVSYVITVSNLGSGNTGVINLFARVPNHTMVSGDQDEGAGCGSAGATNTDCLAGQTVVWQISLNPGESLSASSPRWWMTSRRRPTAAC